MFAEMLVNTSHDLLVFLSVFISGMCIGMIFDVFRALRKVYPPHTGFLSFQDAIFCAIAFFVFSHTVSTYADGDLRWYVFAGLFLGLTLYFFTISNFVLLFLAKVFMITKKVSDAVTGFLKKLFSCALAPFVCAFGKVKQMFFNMGNKMKVKMRKIFKKNFTSSKK